MHAILLGISTNCVLLLSIYELLLGLPEQMQDARLIRQSMKENEEEHKANS